MILKMYAIYDSKAESYGTPIFMLTNGMAIRSFSEAVNNPKSEFHKYPSDYTLFYLGEYDDQTTQIDKLLTPQSLGVALEFKKVNNHENAISNVTQLLTGAEG